MSFDLRDWKSESKCVSTGVCDAVHNCTRKVFLKIGRKRMSADRQEGDGEEGERERVAQRKVDQ